MSVTCLNALLEGHIIQRNTSRLHAQSSPLPRQSLKMVLFTFRAEEKRRQTYHSPYGKLEVCRMADQQKGASLRPHFEGPLTEYD